MTHTHHHQCHDQCMVHQFRRRPTATRRHAQPTCLSRAYVTYPRDIHNRTRARGLTTHMRSESGTPVAHTSGQHKRASGASAESENRLQSEQQACLQHTICTRSRGRRESASSAVSEWTPQPQHAGVDRSDISAAWTAKETVNIGQERSRFNGAGRMLSHTPRHTERSAKHTCRVSGRARR